jgi:hypothetical protein
MVLISRGVLLYDWTCFRDMPGNLLGHLAGVTRQANRSRVTTHTLNAGGLSDGVSCCAAHHRDLCCALSRMSEETGWIHVHNQNVLEGAARKIRETDAMNSSGAFPASRAWATPTSEFRPAEAVITRAIPAGWTWNRHRKRRPAIRDSRLPGEQARLCHDPPTSP